MFTTDNYSLSQGSALALTLTLRDASGNPVVGWQGNETLATVVWPGGTHPASFAPATAWIAPAAATVSIAIAAEDTANLDPGRYQLRTTLTPPGGDPVDCYGCTLDVLAAAGVTPPDTTYCDYADLLKYGRTWLRQLQTDDDEAGFSEQRHRARTWIEDLAHAHFRVAAMTMVIGSQAFGPRRSGARSTWLQDQLDANYLMITDQIREAAAKKALAYICEGQVGLGEQAGQYGRLGAMYHSQANYLGACLILALDTNGDGFPEIIIDCSCSDPMMG